MSAQSLSLAADNAEVARYCCPGEPHAISRAVHLGRLAAYYPACRGCEHRVDVQRLSQEQQRGWAEIAERTATEPAFGAEQFGGNAPHEIDAAVVKHFAAALATVLWNQHERRPSPTVLVAADGHWSSAELVATACDTLQWAGCQALELGAAATAPMAFTARELGCDAALWIGNATGQPHATALHVWGRDGQPWSSPGRLDLVREVYGAKIARPKRRGGGLRRASISASYLQPLVTLFHGLRPLRVVLATDCEPLVADLEQLLASSACHIVRPQRALPAIEGGNATFAQQQLHAVGRSVIEEQAHFGLWVTGDGASCLSIDEHGQAVPAERLFALLADFLFADAAGTVVLACGGHQLTDQPLTQETNHWLRSVISNRGLSVVSCDASREDTFAAMFAHHASLALGTDGQFWFGSQPPAADALWTISLLLHLLSQSDRGLSEVLDGVESAGYKGSTPLA